MTILRASFREKFGRADCAEPFSCLIPFDAIRKRKTAGGFEFFPGVTWMVSHDIQTVHLFQQILCRMDQPVLFAAAFFRESACLPAAVDKPQVSQ